MKNLLMKKSPFLYIFLSLSLFLLSQGCDLNEKPETTSDGLIKMSSPPPVTPEATASRQATTKKAVKVSIDIAPELKKQTSAGETVFVFAKALSGPKAPLAVVRSTVGELPLNVTLDDSKAMSPMFKISDFEEITVIARVSRGGQAIASPGDFQGLSPTIVLADGNKLVKVIIDTIIP